MKRIYLYKEYNDELAYGEEITMLFPTRKEARKHLKARVKKRYGMPLKQMAEDPEFEDDEISKDYVSIMNDGGDTSFFIIEKHHISKKKKEKQLTAVGILWDVDIPMNLYTHRRAQ